MYHSFIIPSSVDEHLGSFRVLAIIYSAPVNIGVHMSFWIIKTYLLVFHETCHEDYFQTSGSGNTHGYFIFGSSLHVKMIVNSLFSGKAVSESQEIMRLITDTEETQQWQIDFLPL